MSTQNTRCGSTGHGTARAVKQCGSLGWLDLCRRARPNRQGDAQCAPVGPARATLHRDARSADAAADTTVAVIDMAAAANTLI